MARVRSSFSAATHQPLLSFLCETLARTGCELLRVDGTDRAGFRLSFEDLLLQRWGIRGLLLPLRGGRSQGRGAAATFRIPAAAGGDLLAPDPFGLFVSILVAVDPIRGLFVAFDAVRHSSEDQPLRAQIRSETLDRTERSGWNTWTREGWEDRDDDFAEALVGFRRDRLLEYLYFERLAEGLDTGHRSLLADEFLRIRYRRSRPASRAPRES